MTHIFMHSPTVSSEMFLLWSSSFLRLHSTQAGIYPSDTLQFLFHSSGPIEESKVWMLLKIVTSHYICISVCGAASDNKNITLW